jgi:hypothetical protein
MAFLANAIHLEAILGAFAAGWFWMKAMRAMSWMNW